MDCDFLIVGAGMAGASAAYELAAHGRTVILEREEQPGYHSTGRSAAMYIESYGNAPVRAITAASRAFFTAPPAGFSEHPLLSPRGVMLLARKEQIGKLEAEYAELRKDSPSVRPLTKAEAEALFPLLRPGYTEAALLDADAMDMDVHAIHQGFLRGAKARGVTLVTAAELLGGERKSGRWELRTRAGRFAAPVLINAAGAWADVVAAMLGVAKVGLVPKRRTAFIFPGPAGTAADGWPLVGDVEEQFYAKPEAGKFLGSPADETPVEPQDIQPEELDIAIAAERIGEALAFPITRIERRWAGLRSFVADKTPVVGFAPDAEGFFWLAGQGGYGIQTSPAMGRIASALARGQPLPEDVAARGLTPSQLAPGR